MSSSSSPGKRTACILLFFLMPLSLLILSWNINEKWVGNRDSCGAFYGVIAKNYLKYGYLDTQLGMVTDRLPDGGYKYYLSHPPVLPILISLSYKVFGIHEWSTRLIPIMFSLATIMSLFIFASNIGGNYYAIICVSLLVPLPMFAYFGRLPTFEPLISFFAMSTLIFYVKWLKHKSFRYYISLCISLFITCIIDWPGYFLLLILIAHFILINRKIILAPLLGLLAISFISGSLYVSHIYLLTGPDGIISIWNKFLYRSGVASLERNLNFTSTAVHTAGSFFEFIHLHIYRSLLYFSVALMFLSAYWAFHYCKHSSTIRRYGIIWCILGLSVLNICVFGNASIYHDFWNFYFSYFFVCASAAGFLLLWHSGSGSKRILAFVLIFAFIFQSFWLLNRRHLQNDGYPLDMALAMSLNGNITPYSYGCSSFTIIPEFAKYYADCSLTQKIRTREMFLNLRNHHIYDYFITATVRDIQSNINFYSKSSQSEASLERLGALSESSELLQYLKKHYPFQLVDGFLIFKLKKQEHLPLETDI